MQKKRKSLNIASSPQDGKIPTRLFITGHTINPRCL